MIITPKIDYLEGCFDTKKIRMSCISFCPFEDEVILKNKSK